MSRPDLLVGIDVGMSCTGVATFNVNRRGLEYHDVNIFREWGGRASENKVPTIVIYDQRVMAQGPTGWGFETEEESQSTENHILGEWFKTRFHTDEKLVSETIEPHPLIPHVDILYQDYLAKLYTCIRSQFTRYDLGNKEWDEARIEFLFSIPATWDTLAVEKFKRIARAAGFAPPPDRKSLHTLTASLTEPLACAIHAAVVESATFQQGDKVLIVDAGGGTTDLSLVTIKNTTRGQIEICEHEGFPSIAEDFGATEIDSGFTELITNRLRSSDPSLGLAHSADQIAWEMCRSQDFQNSKPRLDRFQDNLDLIFRVRIRQLPVTANYEELRIFNGQMEFKWGELAALFDVQIRGIQGLIDRVLIRMDTEPVSLMEANLPNDGLRLSHIILSGGLGSSVYVQNKIAATYTTRPGHLLSNLKVLASTEPRLCVCKGLLYERIQKLQTNKTTISRLACRQSYGILCDKTYSRWNSKHRKLRKTSSNFQTDEDGTKLIKNTVDWFVTKGKEMINGEETKYPYTLSFSVDLEKKDLIGTVKIVTSRTDETPEVRNVNDCIKDEILLVCDFATLDDAFISIRNKHWFQRMFGKKLTKEVRFEIVSRIGSAEVQFECRPIGSDCVLNTFTPAIDATFDDIPVHANTSNVRQLGTSH